MSDTVPLLRPEDFEAIGYWVPRNRTRDFAAALVQELGTPKEAYGYVSATKFDHDGYSVDVPNTRQVRQFFRNQGIDAKVIWADPGYDGIEADVRPPFDKDILRRLRRAQRLYSFKRTSDLHITVEYVIPRELQVSATFGNLSVYVSSLGSFQRFAANGEVYFRKDKLPDFITNLTEHRHPLTFSSEVLQEVLG